MMSNFLVKSYESDHFRCELIFHCNQVRRDPWHRPPRHPSHHGGDLVAVVSFFAEKKEGGHGKPTETK